VDEGPAGAFTEAVTRGRSLAEALDTAGVDFHFDRWLEHALRSRWLLALHVGVPP
jgi:hypothetical protein